MIENFWKLLIFFSLSANEFYQWNCRGRRGHRVFSLSNPTSKSYMPDCSIWLEVLRRDDSLFFKSDIGDIMNIIFKLHIHTFIFLDLLRKWQEHLII